MTSATIIAEGMINLAGQPIWSKDRFRVFDQTAGIGGELEGGWRADKTKCGFQAIAENYWVLRTRARLMKYYPL